MHLVRKLTVLGVLGAGAAALLMVVRASEGAEGGTRGIIACTASVMGETAPCG